MSEEASEGQPLPEPESILSDFVLDDIADQIGIETFAKGVRDELRIAVRRYALDQKVFGSYENELKSVGADYKALNRKISDFRAFLEQPEYSDLASDLYLTALHRNEPAPETDFPAISDFERTRGEPYLLELKRLLSLLEDATDIALDNSAVPKGRKPDYPLVSLVRRLAYVWTELLKQKFSIDYHKGSGLTPAFQFVNLIVQRVIPDVRETEIVTAMRTIVSERNLKAPDPSQE
ncbi:hypothetical protein [Hyphomonas pacifica]|uniref:Uncharacterized protein n=1 Tax=Hyphomonas pacifica TaxID=1280941 RepID=A0A062TZV6_9PROT|nr:hypothetical protein [Hyphomonas pacifica]KCZ47207.1 hypothetical protein HY2_16650 [Hyphomonas pacifica]RAN31058.1 hypothetical protein HY3_17025 [Hyphomonas pacifica]